ncbi:hypothetical protein MBANPS3_010292 [Mucor bainieri]
MSENEAEYVKLISSDGFEFVIHREAAIRSGTIKNMLCGPGLFATRKNPRDPAAVNIAYKFNSENPSITRSHLETSSKRSIYKIDDEASILEIVCRYLYYKWQYEGSTTEIPEFKVDPEVVLETLMTADFLEC